jgi:hypothetical protein
VRASSSSTGRDGRRHGVARAIRAGSTRPRPPWRVSQPCGSIAQQRDMGRAGVVMEGGIEPSFPGAT